MRTAEIRQFCAMGNTTHTHSEQKIIQFGSSHFSHSPVNRDILLERLWIVCFCLIKSWYVGVYEFVCV